MSNDPHVPLPDLNSADAPAIDDIGYNEDENAARERIERMARQSGFEGSLVILAEPEIEFGDCRIEWADGGVVLERAAIEAKINELVGRYMASRDSAENSAAMRTEP